jgi:hypothetical protein
VKDGIRRLRRTLRSARESKRSGAGADAPPISGHYKKVWDLLGFLLPYLQKRRTVDNLEVRLLRLIQMNILFSYMIVHKIKHNNNSYMHQDAKSHCHGTEPKWLFM